MESKVNLFGIQIDNVDTDAAVQKICGWLKDDDDMAACRYVVTPNVDHVVKLYQSSAFRQAYQQASLVLADGRPVVWASRLLRKPLPETVPGADLVPRLFDAASRIGGMRVYLLGAAPGVAARAATMIGNNWRAVRVVGTESPPPGFELVPSETERILDHIDQAGADLLLVGLGAPKQELWVHANRHRLNVKVVLCIGATIDFLAGEKPRAPIWMREHGLEWLHRVWSEPRRLFKRYAYDAFMFPQLVAREYVGSLQPALIGQAFRERTQPPREWMPALRRRVSTWREGISAPRASMPPSNPALSIPSDWMFGACESQIIELVQRVDTMFDKRSKHLLQFMGTMHGVGASSVALGYARASAQLRKRRVLFLSVGETQSGCAILTRVLDGRATVNSDNGDNSGENYSLSLDGSLSYRGAQDASGSYPGPAILADDTFWATVRDEFDEVVVDSQAPETSRFSLIAAAHVDGVLLVVEAERTREDAARRLLGDLQRVGAHVLGAIFNKHRLPGSVHANLPVRAH